MESGTCSRGQIPLFTENEERNGRKNGLRYGVLLKTESLDNAILEL